MGVWCRLDAGLDVAWGVDLIRHGGVDMFPVLCYIAPRLTHKDVAQIALAKTVQCRQGNWLLIEKDNGVAGLVFHGCMSGRLVMMVELCVERPLDRSRLAHQLQAVTPNANAPVLVAFKANIRSIFVSGHLFHHPLRASLRSPLSAPLNRSADFTSAAAWCSSTRACRAWPASAITTKTA